MTTEKWIYAAGVISQIDPLSNIYSRGSIQGQRHRDFLSVSSSRLIKDRNSFEVIYFLEKGNE